MARRKVAELICEFCGTQQGTLYERDRGDNNGFWQNETEPAVVPKRCPACRRGEKVTGTLLRAKV